MAPSIVVVLIVALSVGVEPDLGAVRVVQAD
jgi:hypothetical protein